MKRICLFITFCLLTSIAMFAQRRNDSAFHDTKVSKERLKTVPFRLLPQDYYTTGLGFFCKKEIQVEKTVKFPIKFRLGSVNYCDAMEGKRKNYTAALPQ